MRQLRKDVRQKLQNRSGASVLLALVVMLVAVLASTVVLRAAVSNTGRLLPGEQEEQAYLTVSSAAAILRDELKAPGCSYNWVTTVYSTEGSTETTTERSTTPVSAELAFGPVLNEMATPWIRCWSPLRWKAIIILLQTLALRRCPGGIWITVCASRRWAQKPTAGRSAA